MPDERLRFSSYGGHARAGRLQGDASSRGRGSHRAQYMPHSRKGGGKGLLRARPHADAQRGCGERRPARDNRRCWLRRAGPRQGNRAPRSHGRPRGRLAELSPLTGAHRARRARWCACRHGIPDRGQVRCITSAEPGGDPCTRRVGLCHRAGRLRQVLHLLRRAVYAWRRGVTTRRQDYRRNGAARSGGRSRDHPDRSERQRLSRARPRRQNLAARSLARAHRRGSRDRTDALYDQPPSRYEGESRLRPIAICPA